MARNLAQRNRPRMPAGKWSRKISAAVAGVLAAMLAYGAPANMGFATEPGESGDLFREISIPYEELPVLLEDQPGRMLLSRQEYESLLRAAKRFTPDATPYGAIITSAEYDARIEGERAAFIGTIGIDVLEDGLHALPLRLSDVGLRSATLDGRDAALGRNAQGGVDLFVSGRGRHRLVLEMVSPVQIHAAVQSLSFEVPAAPASRMRLSIPGNVEIKNGAEVVSRQFDETADETRFEVAAPRGKTTLVTTLNNRFLQSGRMVIARSVQVSEVREAFERIHARFSMAVLHRPTQQFQFLIPAGFELTEVTTPLLSHWLIEEEAGRSVLTVQLREQTLDTVVVTLAGEARGGEARWNDWRFPHFVPMEVAGSVAVVGLLLEEGLKPESLISKQMIPIDAEVLAGALPPSIFRGDGPTPPLRPVAAFYAPTGAPDIDLVADFAKPAPMGPRVEASLLLNLEPRRMSLNGGFALTADVEELPFVEILVPTGWHLAEVSTEDGNPLQFEDFGPFSADGATRIRIRLAESIEPGTTGSVRFQAVAVPPGWMDDWESRRVAFPVFSVRGAARERGALAIQAWEDVSLRPEVVEGLIPLDRDEREAYGLGEVIGLQGNLAYRYESADYRGMFRVDRIEPRVTAETYSFLRLEPDLFSAHYEVVFDIREAGTDRVAFSLPIETPVEISIRALDGASIKEQGSAVENDRRRWSVRLGDRRRGEVRLAVSFDERLDVENQSELALPLVRAEDVLYQSGFVAVESDAELEVEITDHPRPVDVGELARARYQPDRAIAGGLSAFTFAGADPSVDVRVRRRTGYALPPAIIERAELSSMVSAEGVNQTIARFLLRSKASFLEIKLPRGASLWSAEVDGTPAKPQREKKRLLLSLPPGDGEAVRDVRIVYEAVIDEVSFWDEVELLPPVLAIRMESAQKSTPVPLADLLWNVWLPHGFRAMSQTGTVATTSLPAPEPAAWPVARWLYELAGGWRPLYWTPTLSRARMAAPRTRALENRAPLMTKAEAQRLESLGYAVSESDAYAADAEPQRRPDTSAPAPAVPPQAAQSLRDADALGTAGRGRGGQQAQMGLWSLAGVRSLMIDFEPTGECISFRSLGADPRVSLTLARSIRTDLLAWGLGIAVGVVGVALHRRSARSRFVYVVLIGLAATLVPLVSGRLDLTHVTNPAFYVACLLVPFYLVAWMFKALVRWVRRPPRISASAAAVLALLIGGWLTPNARAEEQIAITHPTGDPLKVHLVEPVLPVAIPDDAVVIPYDPALLTGFPPQVEGTTEVLIPYGRYEDLMRLASGAASPLAGVDRTYTQAGASYSTVLEGDEYLRVEGRLHVDVHTDGFVSVPIPLSGAVLAEARLDGKPARLTVIEGEPGVHGELETGVLALQIQGRGRHTLTMTLRLKISRHAGWREVRAAVPSAVASALTVQAPASQTQIRFHEVPDRSAYETAEANEVIRTALGPLGVIAMQWRPRIHEGSIDPTLTAESRMLFDVREDGTQLYSNLKLEFSRGERDSLSLAIPADYLVHRVEGENVRGWNVEDGAGPLPHTRWMHVTLLKPASGEERVTLTLHRQQSLTAGGSKVIPVPMIQVPAAALHKGELTIRRSPLLSLSAESGTGVSRIDFPEDEENWAGVLNDGWESPLGLGRFQAYRFPDMPFALALRVETHDPRPMASWRTLLRLGIHEATLETRIELSPQSRPVHQLRVRVPEAWKIESVVAPVPFEWSVSELPEPGGREVRIYLANGWDKPFDVVIRGASPSEEAANLLSLPDIDVLGARTRNRQFAVQADPAFEVLAENLEGCEIIPLSRVHGWITHEQQDWLRLALECRTADYQGVLRLQRREPQVDCTTITNVRVTQTTIEETMLLEFDITRAGTRAVTFVLPARLKDARITAPLLRDKTIVPATDQAEEKVRITLTFQDELMGNLRILIEDDRLLTADVQRMPFPDVETGETIRRYATLESAGRDEVVIERTEDVDALSREQREWRFLADRLGNNLTQAYFVTGDEPVLSFKTVTRSRIETAGARIGLAETLIVADAFGAYRAAQTYKVENSAEQHLEIELPTGADLWSATVAGEPVKPADAPGGSRRRIRIPLVRTAPGDLDLEVVLKYGGTLAEPALLSKTRFPFISVVNIPVELSQVRLFLPEELDWFDFGGTMRRVDSEAELMAGYVRYQTRQTERLIAAMESDSAFARVRAAANLDVQTMELGFLEAAPANQAYMGSSVLSQEWISNSAVLERAREQAQALDTRPGAAGAEFDNRARLGELFLGQKFNRAGDKVQRLESNFAEPPEQRDQKQPVRGKGSFREDWFAANGLQPETPMEQEGRQMADRLLYLEEAAEAESEGAEQGVAKSRNLFERLKKGVADEEAQGDLGLRKEQLRQRGGKGADDTVYLYQQQLQRKQQQVQQEPAQRQTRRRGTEVAGEAQGGQADAGSSGAETYGARPESSLQRELAPMVPASALASVDVNLPVRGRLYRFTTPRGELEVTARGVSDRMIRSLKGTGIALLAAILVLIVYRLHRRGPYAGVRGRTGSTLLILAGLAGVVIGMLPVLGLLAIVVGVAFKIRLRRADWLEVG